MYSLGAIDAGITTGGIGIPSTGGGVGIPPLLIERLPKLDKTGGGGIPANNAGSGTAIFSGGIGILVPNSGVASFDGAIKRTKLESAIFLVNAWLITYFVNFVFGFSSLRLRDFLYNVFHLQGKTARQNEK